MNEPISNQAFDKVSNRVTNKASNQVNQGLKAYPAPACSHCFGRGFIYVGGTALQSGPEAQEEPPTEPCPKCGSANNDDPNEPSHKTSDYRLKWRQLRSIMILEGKSPLDIELAESKFFKNIEEKE